MRINANYDEESQYLYCICSDTDLQPLTSHILILRLTSGTVP